MKQEDIIEYLKKHFLHLPNGQIMTIELDEAIVMTPNEDGETWGDNHGHTLKGFQVEKVL